MATMSKVRGPEPARSPLRPMLRVVASVLSLPACALPLDDSIRAPAEVTDSRIVEASGIVASRRFADHYYVHNDSGNAPLVFLLDRDGATKLTIALTGVENRDWEAISLAPSAAFASAKAASAVREVRDRADKPASTPPQTGGSAAAGADRAAELATAWQVCVADIGDNQARHPTIRVLCFAEPASLDVVLAAPEREANMSGNPNPASAPASDLTPHPVSPAVFEWSYVDGPVDAEGFVVNPHTGDGYILTKRPDGSSDVYKLAAPWRSGVVQSATRVGPLSQSAVGALTIVTDAAVSPDGRRLMTRSYLGAWERTLPASADPRVAGEFEALFARQPGRVDIPLELQGEAICYRIDGRAVLTISEKTPTKLNEVATP